MYGIHNTFLSYGLRKKEQNVLINWYNNTIKPFHSHIHHLNTDEFTDILAVPTFMVIIRFDSLSDEQLEDFNECYKDFCAIILSLNEPKFEVDFEYQQAEFDKILIEAEKVISRHAM